MRKLQQAARKLRHSVQFVISVGRTRIQTTTTTNKRKNMNGKVENEKKLLVNE